MKMRFNQDELATVFNLATYCYSFAPFDDDRADSEYARLEMLAWEHGWENTGDVFGPNWVRKDPAKNS